jgi:hypothetical protein
LNRRATVLGGPDTDEHERHEDVEEAEGEVDALHSNVSVALLAVALDVDVVQSKMGELLHGPVREHDPGHDRVDEQDERVGDTCGDAVCCQYRPIHFMTESTHLLPHFPPQEPMTALQVAAPQQEAAMLHTWSC